MTALASDRVADAQRFRCAKCGGSRSNHPARVTGSGRGASPVCLLFVERAPRHLLNAKG